MINQPGAVESAQNPEEERLEKDYGPEIGSYIWVDDKNPAHTQQVHIRAKNSDGRGRQKTKEGDATVENREVSFLDTDGERFGYSEGGWTHYDNGQRVVWVRSTYNNQDIIRRPVIGKYNKHKDQHRLYPGAVAGAIAHLSSHYDRWSSSSQLTDDDEHSSVHMYSHTIPAHYGDLVDVRQRPEDHGYDVTPKGKSSGKK